MIPPHCMWPLVLSSHHRISSFAIYKAWRHRLISMSPLDRREGQAVAVGINMACPGGCQEGPTAMGKRAWVLTGDLRVQLRFAGIREGARKVVGRPGNPPDDPPGTAEREGQDGWAGREGSLGEEPHRGFGFIVWGWGRNLALPRGWVAASVYLFVNQECAFPFREIEAPVETSEVRDWAESTVGQDSLKYLREHHEGV